MRRYRRPCRRNSWRNTPERRRPGRVTCPVIFASETCPILHNLAEAIFVHDTVSDGGTRTTVRNQENAWSRRIGIERPVFRLEFAGPAPNEIASRVPIVNKIRTNRSAPGTNAGTNTRFAGTLGGMSCAATPKQLLWLFLLLCAAATARAQDNLDSVGIRAFSETCLMPDPRLEKIYEWAAARELKMLEGRARQEDKEKGFVWELATSGRASVLLLVSTGYRLPRHMFSCEVFFREYRDPGKRIETFFLDEMRRRPNAKQERQRLEGDRSAYHFREGDELFIFFSGPAPYPPDETPMVRFALLASQAPPDVAPPTPTFGTVERTYKSFVNYCMALFPDIPAIAERMITTGWQHSGPGDSSTGSCAIHSMSRRVTCSR
jgi:hypothetical protein